MVLVVPSEFVVVAVAVVVFPDCDVVVVVVDSPFVELVVEPPVPVLPLSLLPPPPPVVVPPPVELVL